MKLGFACARTISNSASDKDTASGRNKSHERELLECHVVDPIDWPPKHDLCQRIAAKISRCEPYRSISLEPSLP